MPDRKTIFYKAVDLHSTDDLQNSANTEENRAAKLISIELGAADHSDGEKGVAVTYERVPRSSPINRGHLIIEEYTSETDANLKATELLQRADPVLPVDNPTKETSRAQMFIGTRIAKILVFREKKT